MKHKFKSVGALQHVRRAPNSERQLGQFCGVLGKKAAIFAGLVVLSLVSTPAFAQTPPTVTITSPNGGVDGASFAFGTSLAFQANAVDAEDVDATLTAAISWSSNVDGVLGTGGGPLNISSLTVG